MKMKTMPFYQTTEKMLEVGTSASSESNKSPQTYFFPKDFYSDSKIKVRHQRITSFFWEIPGSQKTGVFKILLQFFFKKAVFCEAR